MPCAYTTLRVFVCHVLTVLLPSMLPKHLTQYKKVQPPFFFSILLFFNSEGHVILHFYLACPKVFSSADVIWVVMQRFSPVTTQITATEETTH